jgi:hypothetical protein
MACPDNAYIPRVSNAGEVGNDVQVMHNGITVLLGSYYGEGPVQLLRKNRGVHEPQEERVFQHVLKTLAPGSVMLELGAYWGFYSMWFCKEVPHARVYLVEPEEQNLEFGRKNFALNAFTGTFIHALVGSHSATAPDGLRTLCVDDLIAEEGLDKIAILHSDIQGAELHMLEGAQRVLPRIDWLFISTHSDPIHHDCADFLVARGFEAVASVTPTESYSMDGILVCRGAHAKPIPPISLSRRPAR